MARRQQQRPGRLGSPPVAPIGSGSRTPGASAPGEDGRPPAGRKDPRPRPPRAGEGRRADVPAPPDRAKGTDRPTPLDDLPPPRSPGQGRPVSAHDTSPERPNRLLMNVVFALALAVAALLFARFTAPGPTRDEAGAVTEAGELEMAELRPGDCLLAPSAADFATVRVVPCAEVHDLQVAALPDAADLSADPPTPEAIDVAATEACLAVWNDAVGTPYAEAGLELSLFTPTVEQWAAGERTVTCLVADPAGPTTGSLLG